MDLDEALSVEVLAEQVADAMLELEYSLVGLCLFHASDMVACGDYDLQTYSEVDNAVVQSGVKEHALELHILRFCFWGLRAVRIVDGERQDGLQPRDEV